MREEWELLRKRLNEHIQNPRPFTGYRASLATTIGEAGLADLDAVLTSPQLSYRDALLIQLAYALSSPGLDTTVRHGGARGVAQQLGKFLASAHVPSVMDALQNVGKNQRNLVRGNFPAFDRLLIWAKDATSEELERSLDYACSRIVSTARPVLPMPEVAVTRLTFAAVMRLYVRMLSDPSEGAHEQYIVASLLSALVQQVGPTQYRVETKRLTASDRSSRAAGDVEILVGSRVLEAYEVTANEWSTKVAGVAEKLREHDLTRVHIVAPLTSSIYSEIIANLAELEQDVSVLDLHGLIGTVVSALTKTYRSVALERLYEYLDRYWGVAERVNEYVLLLGSLGLTVDAGEMQR